MERESTGSQGGETEVKRKIWNAGWDEAKWDSGAQTLVEEDGECWGQVTLCVLDVEKSEVSKGAFFIPKNNHETGPL